MKLIKNPARLLALAGVSLTTLQIAQADNGPVGQACATKSPSLIRVAANGSIFFEDKPIGEAALAAVLTYRVKADSKFRVVMQADNAAPFDVIIKVTDAAHHANIPELPTVIENK